MLELCSGLTLRTGNVSEEDFLTKSCPYCEVLRALSRARPDRICFLESSVWQLCGGWIGCERQPAGQGQAISTAQVTDGEVRIRPVAMACEGGGVAGVGRLIGLGKGGPSET